MSVEIYRRTNLVECNTYTTSPSEVGTLVELLRAKWASLRENEWAGDNPVLILKADDDKSVTEIFSWVSDTARLKAEQAHQLWNGGQILSLTVGGVNKRLNTEILRGFQKNFPKRGGNELLTGVCDCLLDIDGIVKGYMFRASDGIVLMHRSGRADQDNDGKMEMYLHIHEHGCAGSTIENIGNVRIVQNHLLPNDGLVKSLGEGPNDFPAMAIWRVAWKLVTPLGTFMTDPNKPLVFGPSRVTHYPPVGTEFHSKTGPVDLLEEVSGKKVGTLTPIELTAFDIRHTMDDSRFAPLLEKAPPGIFEIFSQYQ
jgi:hypothetical protein